MKYLLESLFFILLTLSVLQSCQKGMDVPKNTEENEEDYSGQFVNQEIELPVKSRTVKGFLSKPSGESLDLVIVLHGGTLNYESSINATINQATKPDGGQQFLMNGKAVFALEYTEFSSPNDETGVTKGIMEMEEVLASVDFLDGQPFRNNNFTIGKLYAFGHSRGGANALLAGIESTKLAAVVSAEGPLNWIAIRDSIASGFLTPTEEQIHNFNQGIAEWNEEPRLWIKYSPGLRIQEFNCPFLVISGEDDEATFQDMAIRMQMNYENCSSCIEGGDFILHPFGHTDWANTPGILNDIQDFINQY